MIVLNPYMFAGAASNPITLTDRTVGESTTGSTAVATYKIDADGYVRRHNGFVLEQWINIPANAANYSVRATLVSGDPGQPTGSALGTWLVCNANRSWSVTATVVSSKTATIFVEIKETASGVVKGSATITINADAADSGGGGGPPGGGGGIEY